MAGHFDTSFILESREGPERLARYSFVGFDPIGTTWCDASGLHVSGALPSPTVAQDPLDYLRRIQAFYATSDHDQPFVGGLVGSLGYDFVKLVEPSLEGTESWPRFVFGLYLDGLVYDHQRNETWYVSRGEDRHERVQELLSTGTHADPPRVGTMQATVDQATFETAVSKAQQLIGAGECFQIVLSRAYEGPFTGDLGAVYDWLREASAVPYLYRLRFAGQKEVLGASPEMLVRVRKAKVETYPIAGTRPLVGDPDVDATAAKDLLQDRKETAEHAMLVDLARNDLGKICRPATVEVPSLMQIQPFRTVQHMVSRVTGQLEPGNDALDALAAVFPAGTVSGAPKLRAMEHIQALESHPRGPYAGAVAYYSFNGDFDSAIAIRSLSAAHGKVTVQAGAGIVHRSDPAAEFQETQHKAQTMLEALGQFGAEVQE